jgi:hypothetical protein
MEKIPSEKPDIEMVEHIEPIQEAVDPDFEKKIMQVWPSGCGTKLIQD